MQESLKEEIRKVADKGGFLRNIFIAIISGLLGIVFGFSQNKIDVNYLVIALFFTGIGIVIGIICRINTLEEERDKLINRLKDLR